MTKEAIEELWILPDDRDYHSAEDISLGIVVLLSGWDNPDASVKADVMQRWVDVAVAWRKQVAVAAGIPIGLRTIYPGNFRELAEVRKNGTRIFLAI
ncbi:hypothetical protein [Sphingomonas crocodyli]|uniref:Uncharacterized protein n=1 Tax=Sphingomonas crocodyli TaxID=1979270 RepID=A0A437LXJ3_9SPHN|nr:hypothetical protein [Sphingomonas crocodyli]RVT90138.1 hypothetical protein EOD43_17675 [Sphingomonas crocodyli]